MPQIYHTSIALHNSENVIHFFLPQPGKKLFQEAVKQI